MNDSDTFAVGDVVVVALGDTTDVLRPATFYGKKSLYLEVIFLTGHTVPLACLIILLLWFVPKAVGDFAYLVRGIFPVTVPGLSASVKLRVLRKSFS